MALRVLGLFTLSPHLPILLCLIFLGGLWLASKMLGGPHPSNDYQYAMSVMMSLIAGALSTQDASYAAVGLVDAATRWRDDAGNGSRMA